MHLGRDATIQLISPRKFLYCMDTTPSAYKINRCRIYLQVITIYDLLTHNTKRIHPEIKRGERVQSRKSVILWLDIPKPPRSYWILWRNLLAKIEALLKSRPAQQNPTSKLSFKNTFYYCHQDGALYDFNDHTSIGKHMTRKRGNIYKTMSLRLVEVTHTSKGIST